MGGKYSRLNFRRIRETVRSLLENDVFDYSGHSLGIVGIGTPKSIGWGLAGEVAKQLDGIDLWLHDIHPDRISDCISAGISNIKSRVSNNPNVADLQDIVEKTDLVVVCLDANKEFKERIAKLKKYSKKEILAQLPKREELLVGNISPIVELAKKFRGYKGNVVMVSNPVDILAYYFWVYSEMPASKIIGFNPDSVLLEKSVRKKVSARKELEKETVTDAFVGGSHSRDMVPLLSQVRINGTPFYDFFPGRKGEELARLIKAEVSKEGTEFLIKFGMYNITHIPANICEICASIYDSQTNEEGSEDGLVSQSTYISVQNENMEIPELKTDQKGNAQIKYSPRGLFIGWPGRFFNGHFIPKKLDLNMREKTDFIQSYNGLQRILEGVSRGELEI